MTKIIYDTSQICEMDLKLPTKDNDAQTDKNINMYAEIDDIIYRKTLEDNFLIKDIALTKDKGLILLEDGRVFMSGQPLDKFDMLNNFPTTVFKEIDSLPRVYKMSTSDNNIFLLTEDSKLLVYGDNSKKQLGIPQIIDYAYKFIELPDFEDIIEIYSTNDRTYIRRSDKSIWYCGKSLYKSDEYMDMFVKIKNVEDSKSIIFGKDCMCIQTYNNQMYYMNFKPNSLDWDRELFKWYMNPMTKHDEPDFILIPQYEHDKIKKVLFNSKDDLIVLYSTGVIYNYGNIFTEYSLNTPITVLNKHKKKTNVIDMMILNGEIILTLPEGEYYNLDKEELVKYKYITAKECNCNNNSLRLTDEGKLYVKGTNSQSQLGASIRKDIKDYISINIGTEVTKDLIVKYLLGL